MAESRLFEILYLLLERRQMTASELAAHFEVSVRTIYRDIDALSAAGIPVFTLQGKGGGIALMDRYVLSRAAFSDEEQRLLLTALQSLPQASEPGGASLLNKLAGLFQRQESDWLQVDLSRWGGNDKDREKFTLLRKAILERQTLTFSYVSSTGETTQRITLPVRLVFKGQGWYLQAWCLERNDYRTFRLSRMAQVEVLSEHFASLPAPPPPIDDPAESCPTLVAIRLRIPPSLAYRAYDEFDAGCIHPSEDGTLLVEAQLPEDSWLYGYLLSFGPHLEVLAPQALKRRLGAMAEEIAKKNQIP